MQKFPKAAEPDVRGSNLRFILELNANFYRFSECFN